MHIMLAVKKSNQKKKMYSLKTTSSQHAPQGTVVVPGKVCKSGFGLLPGVRAVAVQISRYEAQAEGPNGIS